MQVQRAENLKKEGDFILQKIAQSDMAKSVGEEIYSRLLQQECKIIKGDQIESPGFLDAVTSFRSVMQNSLMAASNRRVAHLHSDEGLPEAYHARWSDLQLDESGSESSTRSDETHELEEEESATNREPAAVPETDPKELKKEETRRKRAEDDMMLCKEKKVRDEKGNYYSTIGPFPAPALTVKGIKPGQCIPSRNSLLARTIVDKEVSSGDEADSKAEGVPNSEKAFVIHLADFLLPLSVDSLKKLGESAKVSVRYTNIEEYIAEVIKGIQGAGEDYYLAVLLQRLPANIQSAVETSKKIKHIPLEVREHLPLADLPLEARESLVQELGHPKEYASCFHVFEAIHTCGLQQILSNLRLKSLKKIAHELQLQITESNSVEKYSDAIVTAALPQVAKRIKRAKKETKVSFSVLPSQVKTIADMGFITFTVHNVSMMQKDAERHYSPEVEYGKMKWSLLCMANKEHLSLYLCQTGTAVCKFIITVININEEDSLRNEGTQRFSTISAENDWGFNNVIKFSTLLDPKAGFWNAENDSIMLEASIALLESKAQHVKAAQTVKSHKEERIVQSVADQLLESERLEQLQKKIRGSLNKVGKDEDTQRRDIFNKQQKSWQQVHETHTQERKKILRDIQEREKREQMEAKREQERVRQVVEQNKETTRRIEELQNELSELQSRKKSLTQEVKESRKWIEPLRQELATAEQDLSALQQKVQGQELRLESSRKVVADLETELNELEEITEDEASTTGSGFVGDETDLMQALQRSLASIIDV